MPQRGIAYTRTSTDRQDLGMEAQVTRLRAEAAHRGITLVGEFADQRSGKDDPFRREGLRAALEALQRGEADVLMVAKLDRVSRDTYHLLGLLNLAQQQGWELVALDLGTSTKTPEGRLQATIMAALAEYERIRIGQRISDALQQRARRGLHNGRPSTLTPDLRAAIEHMCSRDPRPSLRQMAYWLTEQGFVTSTGNPYSASHVARLVAAVVAATP